MAAPPVRRVPPRRRSSGSKKLLPLLALAQLGKSDSFTLKAPTQPAVATTGGRTVSRRGSMERTKSCPSFGKNFNRGGGAQEPSRSAAKRRSTVTELNLSFSDFSSFDLGDAAAPLMDAAGHLAEAAGNSMEMLGNIGHNFLPDSVGNTETEAKGLNLASHALLDFPATMAKAAVAAKAAEVAGRLFVLSEAMLPGHEMMHDEMAFQVGFLAVSCNALYQTVMPKIKASQACKFLTPEDRKAYRSLFKPAGMTWTQYREMNIHSMEWVTLEPGQALAQDDAYWLYDGEVNVGDETVPSGLIGEDYVAKTLGIFNGEHLPADSMVAGPEGAKVLKMNSQKLGRMLKNDESLQAPLGKMLYNSMQHKLERVTRKGKASPAFQRHANGASFAA